jgi:hypothetical protein
MAADRKDARDAIARTIRALLAKTVENGCTEAEAVSAATIAAKLLARHEMDLDEAEIRATPFEERAHAEPDALGERLVRPAGAIATLTRCSWWRTGPGISPVRITFLGLSHEVEIAGYLLAICARAMRSESERLGLGLLRPDARRRRLNAFLDGMSVSLRDRIQAMVPPEPAAEGRGLVVLRGALVAEELARRGIELEDMRARGAMELEPDFVTGRRAGDAVALDRGLSGGGPAAALPAPARKGAGEEGSHGGR